MAYNLTFMENSTNIVEVMSGFNGSIGSEFLLGTLLCVTFTIIFFITMYRSNDINNALLMNLIASTVFSFIVYSAGFTSVVTVSAYAAFAFFAIVGKFST